MGQMTVLERTGPVVHEFNGIPAEREEVAKTFDELMAKGHFLAYKVVDAPGTKKGKENVQIRQGEFPVEDENAEVLLTPALVGG